MSTMSWHDLNNAYLAASLRWLRVRLDLIGPERMHPADGAHAGVPAPPPVPARNRLARLWAGSPPQAPNVRLLPMPRSESQGERLRQAADEREAAAVGMEPPPALQLLADRLGLSTFERDTLLLCAAVEFDPGFEAAFARAQGDPARTYPTFGLALAALDDPAWDALSAFRPLRHARVLEISQPGATPLTSSALRVDERIVNYLKGLNVLDDRLAMLLAAVDEADERSLARSQRAAVASLLERLRVAAPDPVLPVAQLTGPDAGSKVAVAHAVCDALGRGLYRIGVEALPSQLSEIEALARLWQRESVLVPIALYIDAEGVDELSADAQAAFHRFLSRGAGPAFVGVREAPIRFGGPTVWIEVNRPTAAEQCELWSSLLGASGGVAELHPAARALAGQFTLNLHEIREVAASVVTSPTGPAPVGERLWDACRDRARPRLDTLAQRLDVKAGWSDLVLPEDQMSLMRQIAGQVRERHRVYGEWGFALKMNRGFGITALFTGESGTGKTMAAEVIANDLRLNLYRIDLSAVVSKYIGETSRNLRKLFDAAEQGGAILFFDEADALFGKRSEVKDSHDRYANIEINYLLQRMEAFSGLAILATNMKTALDTAFLRRLRFVVNFQFPGQKERKLIWQKALPVETPREALDYDRLARLNVTGGNIHSIAINAAFLAVSRGTPVTMSVLVSAARTEMRKLEKPFSDAELRLVDELAGAP